AALVRTDAEAGSGTGTGSRAAISCPGDCSEEFDNGTEVTLSALSGANTKQVVWTGCASNPTPTECKVTMDASKGVTATFNLEKRLLTVTKAGSGAGTVTSSPGAISCPGT